MSRTSVTEAGPVCTGSGATRDLRVGCDFRFLVPHPTPAVAQVQPRLDGAVLRREWWEAVPEVSIRGYRDGFGNRCARLVLPPGEVNLRYDARVAVPDAADDTDPDAAQVPVDALPDEVLIYLLPSRYCTSDLLPDQAWDLFGGHPPGWRRVQAIVDHVHDHLRFGYGTSGPTTTAAEAYRARTGVCRDYAHVAISLCRALHVPARYVFGYLPDIEVPPPPEPMDFCAWFEAYLGGRWFTFDPRNNQFRKGRVVVGRGRDAVDVAMVTTFGGPELESMTVWAEPGGDGCPGGDGE